MTDTLQRQRDALAEVVRWAWEEAIKGNPIDPEDIEYRMAKADLIYERYPTDREEAREYDVRMDQTFFALTVLGHEALEEKS